MLVKQVICILECASFHDACAIFNFLQHTHLHSHALYLAALRSAMHVDLWFVQLEAVDVFSPGNGVERRTSPGPHGVVVASLDPEVAHVCSAITLCIVTYVAANKQIVVWEVRLKCNVEWIDLNWMTLFFVDRTSTEQTEGALQ